MTLEAVGRLVDVPERGLVRFMNLFEDVVVPRLTSLRQVVRYLDLGSSKSRLRRFSTSGAT